MSRLLLVAHRLPVSLCEVDGTTRLVPSIGGLATALSRVHARSSTLWVGCPSDFPSSQDRERLRRDLECARMVAIDVPRIELARYYEGFSNGVLWPLFHYLLDKVHLLQHLLATRADGADVGSSPARA